MKNITAGTTVELKFNTVDATGAAVAPSAALAASDFKIYKDSSATARTSTAGIVVVSPFGGKVGVHQIKINTSDNTDPGFYAAGSSYTVIPDTTKTSNSVLIDGLLFDDNTFGIEYGFMRGTDSSLLAVTWTTMFSGITSLAEWLGLITGSQTGNAQALLEINATGAGGGVYDPTTDSNEALRNRGDTAWITGSGGAGTTLAITVVASVASSGEVTSNDLIVYLGETKTVAFTIVDQDGNAIDMSTKDYILILEKTDRTFLSSVAKVDFTPSGAGNNILTTVLGPANTTPEGKHSYSLRNPTDVDQVFATAAFIVKYAPVNP